MRKIMPVIFSVLLLPVVSYAEDSYDRLARDISAASGELSNKKIAIIPFSYTDNTASIKDGSVIAERLTMKLINARKFEIIERSVLDKVLNELKLQNSGAIDASSAKELGKVLGVDAIVTGTLIQTTDGKIEVNARLIKTETAQAIAASQVNVVRDWLGGDAQQVQTPVQQPVYQSYQKKPYVSAARGENQYGFFDIMLGFGAQTIDMKFANNTYGEKFSDLGITYAPDGPYSSIEYLDLVGRGVGPIGFRVGGFGNGVIGGDFEFSVSKHAFDKQTISVKTGSGTGTVQFPVDDYLDVTSFGFSGDLLLRAPNKMVDPYFGIGLGLSLNRIQLPYIKGYTNSSAYARPTDDFGVGLMFRIPVGVRVKFDAKTHFYAELRYELNSMTYDRGVKNEEDTITTGGARFVTGVGFAF